MVVERNYNIIETLSKNGRIAIQLPDSMLHISTNPVASQAVKGIVRLWRLAQKLEVGVLLEGFLVIGVVRMRGVAMGATTEKTESGRDDGEFRGGDERADDLGQAVSQKRSAHSGRGKRACIL